ncbi:RNA polymerase subunit sigma-70 [Spongiactinospora gelatinilytica]|uniref:RNA polymerase sigma factor n=1 Tax=Spongiactinospora gelatinilytica TaxID=2666298 RepID=A0A2W2FET7_9ACTN|nr:RNA polymerase subunit sigma-70 [Spongiactinospora gelatinilytica]PZG23228.1 RNA polymerase subunit sigma-70 [Spongiactinospora gelatinilytica]
MTPQDRTDFAGLIDEYRQELLVHCRRILGSAQEAEDLVQETYLRAWRAYDGFQGRSSVRSWLYRIATNACLNAIESRGRRPLPTETAEPWWAAGVVFGAQPADPAVVTETRAGVRLAVAATWRHLTPKQRAVLILRDVLNWPAAEVAVALGSTSAAVHSTLLRARARMSEAAPEPDEIAEPDDACRRDLLDRYVNAFENADAPALTRLLTEDAVCELTSSRLTGREAITRFLANECPAFGTCRMVPTTYAGHPAFATYAPGPDGRYRAYSVETLTLTPAGVSRIVSHQGTDAFRALGLPLIHR